MDNKLLSKIKNNEKLTEEDIHSGEGLKLQQSCGYDVRTGKWKNNNCDKYERKQ